MTNTKNIPIPSGLYRKLHKLAQESDMDSAEDLILFILQDYMDRNVVKEDMEPNSDDDALLRKRLEDLGYM